ncbi:hypothetical protein EPUS_04494 [Endocarpon pusillum Z07020]|uniref:Uncharacterized protein n=1 Tax=Endocarpon pusillum (strain Z07020 / HMAS-L-300199) TaxID=1263415 RepID=U1FVJ0_ENDPU|nr:uncharacterized protein EPUS_04494 [Endocarpon pusillum Z07020]ERF68842.1 hypothetical protein EPUS_04494 [Endocarpon pusillum Z07020]
MATPSSPQFDWRGISVLGPYGLLIRYIPHQPANQIPFDTGDINNGINNVGMNYTLFVNAGRTGSPGLEVTVTIAAANNQPQVSVTIILEPGVHAGREGSEEYYNLHLGDTQFLGLSGGGGHMYDHDPAAVHLGVPSAQRKETLRIKLVSHGHVCHDPEGLAAIRARLPPGSNDARLLDAMTSARGMAATGFHAWFYCRVPTAQLQIFTNSVLFWFRWMCGQRYQPLFQYPMDSLGLSMDPLPGFRNSMYCDMVTHQGTQVLGDPVLQISDTIGSRDRRIRAVANSVALVRENQGHEAFCTDVGKSMQGMKLLRSTTPFLRKASRLLTANNSLPARDIPTDPYGYIGYIYIGTTSRSFPITTPRPGSLFHITWYNNLGGNTQGTPEFAYGMVLTPDSARSSTGANFALSLRIPNPAVRQSAQANFHLAVVFPVKLRFIENRQVPLVLFSRMVRFSGFSTNPTMQALQANVLRPVAPSPFRDDLHRGPNPPLNDPAEMTRLDALFQGFAQAVRNSPLMVNIRQIEGNLLFNVPGQITGKTQLIRATISASSFRAVYGLILVLVGMGHRTILVVDEPEDRSRVCWDLFDLFQRTSTTDDHYGRTWRAKRLMSYSTTDVDYKSPATEHNAAAKSDLSNSGNPLRPALDLYFKMLLDDLPSHAYMHDQGALHNAGAAAAPQYHTPQAMSWADHAQAYFNLYPGDRAQHFADRARVLNGQVAAAGEATAMLERLSLIRRNIISRADVLVCDSDTAMGFDVRASFLEPLIFLGNTHRMEFARGASVLLQHPKYVAFVLGNLDDQRYGRVRFASEGRNEAMLTMRRSLWETYVWAGQQVINLT